MSWEELNRLKPVSPVDGDDARDHLTPAVRDEGRGPLRLPDKDPAVRLRVLEDAGRLSIPFTTGLLVGHRRDLTERAETIFALRQVARAYGAVQEVIVQNFRAKPDTAMRHADDLGLDEYRAAIAVTRSCSAPRRGCRRRPNLVDLDGVPGPARRRRRRLGRVSPLTPDHVNPERPWPSLERLRRSPPSCGFELGPADRAPEYVRQASLARPAGLGHVCAARADDGLAKPAYARPACLAGAGRRLRRVGRTDLLRGRRHRGRTDDRRSTSPTSTATGTAAGADCPTRRRQAPSHARHPRWAARRTGQPLRRARADLMTPRASLLDAGMRLADALRREAVGDDVTYVVNRNINFTNVCYVGCRLLRVRPAPHRRRRLLALPRRGRDRAEEAWELGRHRGLHAGRHRSRAARPRRTSTSSPP
jgi:FO synthase